MKDLVFSNHAKLRMKQRNIHIDDAERLFWNAKKIAPTEYAMKLKLMNNHKHNPIYTDYRQIDDITFVSIEKPMQYYVLTVFRKRKR